MVDFRDVVDYFAACRGPTWDAHQGRVEKVKGVKISCEGDEVALQAKKYIAVDVPTDHPVFAEPTAPVTARISLPIKAHKYPPDRRWNALEWSGGRSPYNNQAATSLQTGADPTEDSWGLAPTRWQNRVGSVLVVRQDGKDITPQHVEALCHFCQYKLQPIFEDGVGAGSVQRSREDVLAFMTKAVFEGFFWGFRAERLGGDGTAWKDVASPFSD